MKFHTLSTSILAILLSVSTAAFAEGPNHLGEKSSDAAEILSDMSMMPDHAIPHSLLQKAACIATIPNFIRAGFIIGASHGQGLVSCRTPGGWSNPSFFTSTGGSWGLQIGVESTDVVLVFLSPNAAQRLVSDNFTLGADASIAAGPLGRDAQAGTDYELKSEIYSYSHGRGLFAGLTINGSVVKVDHEGNAIVYGPMSTADILSIPSAASTPAIVAPYVNALRTAAP